MSWTAEQKERLRFFRLECGMTYDQCASALGIEVRKCRSMANSMGWTVNKSKAVREDFWQQCEDDFLRANWLSMTVSEMSYRLGRSESAIYKRRQYLGIKRKSGSKAA